MSPSSGCEMTTFFSSYITRTHSDPHAHANPKAHVQIKVQAYNYRFLSFNENRSYIFVYILVVLSFNSPLLKLTINGNIHNTCKKESAYNHCPSRCFQNKSCVFVSFFLSCVIKCCASIQQTRPIFWVYAMRYQMVSSFTG